ncbi:MAG: prepilin-type N-terminal cleavage/methylation domain-containing protein [Acidobacteria bacterium]|nr:prepilin-type N-terminal cleavage/methylation domain-containing protein [Acidobacteriota bacterium]
MSFRTARRNDGFTLLEITIVLAVVAILGLILAPSMLQFLSQSRLARAQNDVRALGDAVVDFVEDNGFHPQWADGGRSVRISLLVSPGAVGEAQPGAEGWLNTQPGQIDLISNQLVNNNPSFGGIGYPLKTALSGAGWNGPYIANMVEEDPWGNRYVINVGHLSNSIDAVEADGIQEKRAVWVLSAGPDGIFDTTYPTTNTQLLSNAAASPADISTRIQ